MNSSLIAQNRHIKQCVFVFSMLIFLFIKDRFEFYISEHYLSAFQQHLCKWINMLALYESHMPKVHKKAQLHQGGLLKYNPAMKLMT